MFPALVEFCFHIPQNIFCQPSLIGIQIPIIRNVFVFSLGLEVLEVMPEPDVVVVCCGGGGLLAGVAAAIKLSGCDKTRIYGVEPEGGKTRRQIRIKGVSHCEAKMNLKCLFEKQPVRCTKVSLRRSQWAWTARALRQGSHHLLQVSFT